jgi:hypothetical protein
MEYQKTVHLYVDADAIEACVDSMGSKTSITVHGVDERGKVATVTGTVLKMELGHERFTTHGTLVILQIVK